MIYLHNCDYRDLYITRSFDAIITDPPYDFALDIDGLLSMCSGNVVLFCSPKKRFIRCPDEIGYWVKTPSTKNYSKHIGNFVEEILIMRNGETFNPLHWSQMTGVWDDRIIYPQDHPWEKPLSLIERLVRIYTNPGDTVFDPFAGSGTTGEACANLGRNFIGCEIDKKYFEIATRRLSKWL